MGQVSNKLRSGSNFVVFFCPGCTETHSVTTSGEGAWGFNQDFERPTFTPSILVRGKKRNLDAEGHWVGGWERDQQTGVAKDKVCHSFVRDGEIQFLGDCTHPLAGQTVALPDLPQWMRDRPFSEL